MFVMVAILSGCASSQPTATAPKKPFEKVRIVVGAIGDRSILPTVSAQRGEWMETRGGNVAIRDEPVDPKSASAVNVILFPGDRLGDMIEAGALLSLPESVVHPSEQPGSASEPVAAPRSESLADAFAFDDLVPAYRDRVTRYGDDRAWRIGLPYGASALVLIYRREALETDANRKAAHEAGIALEPPQTWDKLDALARFLNGRDCDGDGQPEAGISLALGNDSEEVADDIFFARSAALGQHRDQYSFLFDADSMEPRIASPPFVAALTKLVALQKSGPPGMETESFDAEAARAAFREGKAALLIDRAERASRWTDAKHPMKVGVAPLPGSEQMFDPSRKEFEAASPPNNPTYLSRGGGWVVGISASSTGKERDAAIDFMKYLASPETSNRVFHDQAYPQLPVRVAQFGEGLSDPRSAAGVDSRAWSRAVRQTLLATRVVPGLRIPDAEGYLADVRKARVAALKGEPAQRALDVASKAWSERTERLGVKRQLWHYRRSLNVFPTEPQPPAR
jgi:ABC-type glycerol-3-phosphate transport system substrate-binding protein